MVLFLQNQYIFLWRYDYIKIKMKYYKTITLQDSTIIQGSFKPVQTILRQLITDKSYLTKQKLPNRTQMSKINKHTLWDSKIPWEYFIFIFLYYYLLKLWHLIHHHLFQNKKERILFTWIHQRVYRKIRTKRHTITNGISDKMMIDCYSCVQHNIKLWS